MNALVVDSWCLKTILMDWWWTPDFLLSAFEAVCCVRRRAAPVSRLQARRVARVVAGFAKLPLPVNHQSIHFFVVVNYQSIQFFVVSKGTTNPIRSYSQQKSTTNPWQFFTCPQPIQKSPGICTLAPYSVHIEPARANRVALSTARTCRQSSSYRLRGAPAPTGAAVRQAGT